MNPDLAAYLDLIDRLHVMLDAEPWWNGRFAHATAEAARLWDRLHVGERQLVQQKMRQRYAARIG